MTAATDGWAARAGVWALCLVVVACAAGVVASTSAGGDRVAAGDFRIGYESDLAPVRVNVMHSWVLTVETVSGEPVTGAAITVTGGMPDHDHGLPTAPRVTVELGDGRYLLEGMKFHMRGRWQLVAEVSAMGRTETATFELEL